jgi:DNA-binding MarR family transcriptional regulator
MADESDSLPPVELWSSADLPLGILLGKTAFHLRRAFSERIQISGKAYGLLRLLELHDGISQSGIERFTRWDGATVTRLAKQLEREGLVRRVPDPADNRFTNVFLTGAGREKLAGIQPMFAGLNEAAFADIRDEDLKTIRRSLEQIQRNLENLRCHD